MKKSKRDAVLEAAEQLMTEMPSNEISVDMIARRAGIGKGSIYYYFSSRDEILYEVIELGCRRGVHEYYSEIGAVKNASALEKIKQLFLSVIRKEFGSSEKNLLPSLTRRDDMTVHHIIKCAAVQEISPVLEALLREGIAEGSIQTDTPKESAEMIVAILTFLLDEDVFPESGESAKKKLKIMAGVLETCLHAEKGSFDFILDASPGRQGAGF